MEKKKVKYGKSDLLDEDEFHAKYAKERISIWIDEEVINAFRERANEENAKYQTLINQALRRSMGAVSETLEAVVRRVVRQELGAHPSRTRRRKTQAA